MRHFPSTVVAGLLASVVLSTVVPVFAASSSDGSPQCGGDKTEKGDEKPKAPSGL